MTFLQWEIVSLVRIGQLLAMFTGSDIRSHLEAVATLLAIHPNQTLEPTITSVMNPAEPGFTPAAIVAHL